MGRMWRRWTLVPVVVLALAGSACTPADRDGATGGPSDDGDAVGAATDAFPPAGGTRVALRTFDSCDALLDAYRDLAVDLVGPYGLGGGYAVDRLTAGAAEEDSAATGAEGAAPQPAAAAQAPGGGTAFSGTNNQEEGVDEPDLVKTDGDLIAAVSGGRVRLVSAADATELGSVPLPRDMWQHELLLAGDDLLVLSTGAAPGPPPRPFDDGIALVPAFTATRTTLTRVDVSDPRDPTVTASARIEGAYRSARLVGGVVRLVLQTEPTGLVFTVPTDGGLDAEDEALEENRRIVRESGIDDWVPHYQLEGTDGARSEPERLVPCDAIGQPQDPAGLSTLSVVTLDVAGGLEPTSAAGVVANGETVYASASRLVVATSRWGAWAQPFFDVVPPPSDGTTTDLHSFDISDPAATRYVASGSIDGVLLNQFSLSEHEGHLRVATTQEPEWISGEASSSSVVVLVEDGDELVETGRVDGLGETERIYAVRYLGDLAAVVTFRQTDPLYLLDLADPAAPTLRGELHIPGFSSYLHPVGDGHLLGIGQDADPETGQPLGLQASLFDVRDPASPQRVAQVVMGSGYSPVESDHRAFLWWEPAGRAVVPAELWGPPGVVGPEGEITVPEEQGEQFGGAVVLGVDAQALTEVGRISSRPQDAQGDTWSPPVQRSLVIGADLWTLTELGLVRYDLASLEQEAALRFTS